MSERRAFGAPSAPRGERDQHRRRRVDSGIRPGRLCVAGEAGTLARDREGQHSVDPAIADGVEGELLKLLLGDQQPGLGEFHEHAQLIRRHPRVERHEDRTEPGAGKQQLKQRGTVRPQIANAVSGQDAVLTQPGRRQSDLPLELGIPERAPLEPQGHPIRRPAAPIRYPTRDVHKITRPGSKIRRRPHK